MYELAYRIPGICNFVRKNFKTAAKRGQFIDKLVAKHGDDIDTQTRDPEPSV